MNKKEAAQLEDLERSRDFYKSRYTQYKATLEVLLEKLRKAEDRRPLLIVRRSRNSLSILQDKKQSATKVKIAIREFMRRAK